MNPALNENVFEAAKRMVDNPPSFQEWRHSLINYVSTHHAMHRDDGLDPLKYKEYQALQAGMIYTIGILRAAARNLQRSTVNEDEKIYKKLTSKKMLIKECINGLSRELFSQEAWIEGGSESYQLNLQGKSVDAMKDLGTVFSAAVIHATPIEEVASIQCAMSIDLKEGQVFKVPTALLKRLQEYIGRGEQSGQARMG